MSERFTDHLRKLASPIWAAQHRHPLVRGIGDGSLDIEKFKFWLRQDYLFLIDYARLFGVAITRAPDARSMRRFAQLASATLETEMDLHRSYAEQFGIGVHDLEAEIKAPATQGYTDFLLRTAAMGDYVELVAALLPCMWGFSEIGQSLAAGKAPAAPRYAQWVEMYAAPEFAKLAEWCRRLLDSAAEGLPGRLLRPLEAAFLTSSRYELLFWESAWNQQQWPD